MKLFSKIKNLKYIRISLYAVGVAVLISIPYLPRWFSFGTGTDDQAVQLVQHLHKGYEAWFQFAPELSESQEQFRFAAQIALGIVLCVFFMRSIVKHIHHEHD